MTTSSPLDGTVPGLLARARTHGTGCLQVVDRDEVRSGQVYLVEGALVAVDVDGFRPRVGHRLRSGGLVTPEAFEEAVAAHAGDIHSPHLGLELVRRGHLAADVLAAVHRELILSAVGAMSTWVDTEGTFLPGVTATSFTMDPLAIGTVLKAVLRRRQRWELLWAAIGPGLAVEECYPLPHPVPAHSASVSVPAEAEALLQAMDGRRTVDEVAGVCGFTRFETGYLLHALVRAQRAEIVVRPGAPTQVLLDHPVPEYSSVPPADAAFHAAVVAEAATGPRPLPWVGPPSPPSPPSPPPSPEPSGGPAAGRADAARATRARALAALDRHLVAVDDVQAALGRIQQHAADAGLDTPRLETTAADAEHAAQQVAQEVATVDRELAAVEAELERTRAELERTRAEHERTQAEHDRVAERAGAIHRAAAEGEAHRDTACADLHRAVERAASIAAEQQRLRAEADRLAVVTSELQDHVTAADTLLRTASADGG